MYITESDIRYLRKAYPQDSIKMPSVLQQRMILMAMRGLSPPAITRLLHTDLVEESGAVTTVARFLSSPTALAVKDLLAKREFDDVRVTREHLTDLLFFSYHKSATATEEVTAIREIGKLNGLYLSDKPNGVTINQTTNTIHNKSDFSASKIKSMSESELASLAQTTIDNVPDPLNPTNPLIEPSERLVEELIPIDVKEMEIDERSQ